MNRFAVCVLIPLLFACESGDGGSGGTCTVEDLGDGTALITCPDGSTAPRFGRRGRSGR